MYYWPPSITFPADFISSWCRLKSNIFDQHRVSITRLAVMRTGSRWTHQQASTEESRLQTQSMNNTVQRNGIWITQETYWRGKAFWERERGMHHVSMESSVSWSASIESWISNNCSRILLLQLTTHPQLNPRYSRRSNNMIEEPAASLPLFEILNIRREVTLIGTDERCWSSRQFVCYLMCLFAAASQRGGPISSHRPWACGIVSPTALQPQLQWWRVFWHWVLHSSVRYKLPAMSQPWRRNCCE